MELDLPLQLEKCIKYGQYIVFELQPQGFVDVGDSDGEDPNRILVDLTNGVSVSGLFFVDEQQSLAPSLSVAPSTSPSSGPTTTQPIARP